MLAASIALPTGLGQVENSDSNLPPAPPALKGGAKSATPRPRKQLGRTTIPKSARSPRVKTPRPLSKTAKSPRTKTPRSLLKTSYNAGSTPKSGTKRRANKIDSPRTASMGVASPTISRVKTAVVAWQEIRTGDTIEFTNCKAGLRLFSNKQAFSHTKSSRTQQIGLKTSGLKTSDQTAGFFSFVVAAPELTEGEPMKNNTIVTLRHKSTQKWLVSSRDAFSPATAEQEVSCSRVAKNEKWILKCRGSCWKIGEPFRLVHHSTNTILRSTCKAFGSMKEVSCSNTADDTAMWAVSKVVDAPFRPVTFGMSISIKHALTGKFLHSHKAKYFHAGGSGQQQVSCVDAPAANDVFIVETGETLPPMMGERVANKSIVRFRHQASGKYLGTKAGLISPSTAQQEVSCLADTADDSTNWQLQMLGAQFWHMGLKFNLLHRATGTTLRSHTHVFDLHKKPKTNGSVAQQQEITCTKSKDATIVWTAAVAHTRPVGLSNIGYGRVVRLAHKKTNAYLQANVSKYHHEGGSRNLQVSCTEGKRDIGSQWWVVEPSFGTDPSGLAGKPVKNGAIIRLRNLKTNCYMHGESKFCGPTTKQDMEISCTDAPDASSKADNFKIQWPMMPISGRWVPNQLVRFVHCDSKKMLRSHAVHLDLGIVTRRQQEVTAQAIGDDNTTCWWSVSNIKTK